MNIRSVNEVRTVDAVKIDIGEDDNVFFEGNVREFMFSDSAVPVCKRLTGTVKIVRLKGRVPGRYSIRELGCAYNPTMYVGLDSTITFNGNTDNIDTVFDIGRKH